MKKLSIGITCYPSVGGSGVVATNLGNELARLGHKVHFITYERPFLLKKSKNIYFHKVKFNDYSLFKYPDYTLPLAEKMVEVHQKYKLDLFHVHYAVPHATAGLLAKKVIKKSGQKKVPCVITTLHGTDITLLAKNPNIDSIIRCSIEDSCGVTAVSKSLKNDTKKILKTKKSIQVIYNFYNPKPITKSESEVRKELKIKKDDFLAVHLSNLRDVKRIPDLLKIISRLKKYTNIKLLILAGSSFKPFLLLVKKLKIQKQIIVRENVRDIENYLNSSDFGIYTSEKESFGMGILETMSFGKPILATRVGGIPEVIKNKKTGLLFPIGDINAFADTIKKLEKDRELAKKMGRAGKKYAETKFSTGKIVKQYLTYYQKILKDNC